MSPEEKRVVSEKGNSQPTLVDRVDAGIRMVRNGRKDYFLVSSIISGSSRLSIIRAARLYHRLVVSATSPAVGVHNAGKLCFAVKMTRSPR